jgi:hypothetical protein
MPKASTIHVSGFSMMRSISRSHLIITTAVVTILLLSGTVTSQNYIPQDLKATEDAGKEAYQKGDFNAAVKSLNGP